MEKPKKTWTRPQLIVLSRATAEEAVLEACKYPSIRGANTSNCKVPGAADCSTLAPS